MLTKRFDVAIIGSGAAGSVMAWRLAGKGLGVVVLERGGREKPDSFEHSEYKMMPRVYKYGGLQTSADNDLVILQGCTVGGSTVVNNAIWMRSDLDRILPEWSALGAPIDRQGLLTGFDELERLLNVTPIALDATNAGTPYFLQGSAAAGISAKLLDHNRKDCLGCGWCNYGCRYNRKTSMLVTLIPWAERKGAEFRDRCERVRLAKNGNRIVAAEYERGGSICRVEADRFVVCAGAIGSSEVLLGSGITQNKTVGRGLHALGGVLVTGAMPAKIDPYDGIGLTSQALVGRDYVVESFFSPPGAFAVTAPGWFEDHAARMAEYTYSVQAGVMVGCGARGVITAGGGRKTKIDLAFSSAEVRALREGIKDIARILFRAGAKAVYPSTYRSISLTRESELPKLDAIIKEPQDLLLGSAHPQGGNPVNEDPRRGVVDLNFRVHGLDNLFVADASVFPTNIWANCQATVMAVAHHAASFVGA